MRPATAPTPATTGAAAFELEPLPLPLREAVLRWAVRRDVLLRDALPPLREAADLDRVALDFPFELLAPLRDFEPLLDVRRVLPDDAFRVLGALPEDERALA